MFRSAGSYGLTGTLPMESECGRRVGNRALHTRARHSTTSARRGVENRPPMWKAWSQWRSVSNTSRTFSTRRWKAASSRIISTARSRLWMTVE